MKAAVTDMAIQWACFGVAAYFQTEKFYDLAGSSTFLILVMQSIMSSRRFSPRQVASYRECRKVTSENGGGRGRGMRGRNVYTWYIG